MCIRDRSYLGALSIGLGFSQTDSAFAEEDVEEVVVTASKREANLQDLPMAVQAITSEELEAKNISDFNDIANLVPSITVDDSGSGNSYFYIRGVSDGGFGNRAGAQASTALYIDEQPLSTIGGNPDLHVYDIERVEILTGPQGTLYGSSSQAGTVRIITKKPNPDATELGFDVEYGDVHDGTPDRSLEAFVNLPLGGLSGEEYELVEINFEEGDLLVQLSDGLPEAPNPGGDLVDYERLYECIEQNAMKSPKDVVESLVDLAEKWLDGNINPDDITIVATKKG